MIDTGKTENEENVGLESDIVKPLVSGSDQAPAQSTSRPQSINYGPKKSVNFEEFDCEEGLITKKEYNSPVDSAKVFDETSDGTDDSEAERASWGGKLEFIFTCIGYAVGLGNVWRFPYLCYKNGGGAFLVPYIFMLAFVGLPLFYMELAFGQFASLGPITIWRINPLLKGLGYAMVSVSWLIGVYYNVVIAHVLLFFIETLKSLGSPIPWDNCDNYWNTPHCIEPKYKTSGENDTFAVNISTSINGTFSTLSPVNLTAGYNISQTVIGNITNGTGKSPTEEFYYNYILEKSSGIDEMGAVNWKLALCLMLAWAIVLFALIRGIQSLGKVVYFTAIFPYLVLTIMLIRGVTLPGAGDGILYYLKPDFSKLANARVWADAATQIFFSLSACHGGLIAMSSYNKFNNNCLRDSLIVALINCGTSLYAGLVIFSVLGFMARAKGVSVGDVAEGGPGLAFVVYPEALAQMPVPHLWSILFFVMMATLGFGSQFSIVECILSAFSDELYSLVKERRNSIIFRSLVVIGTFLVGLPMVCKGGIYLLNLVDYSVSGFPLLVVGFMELVALNWWYGFDRFSEDISMMLGKEPNIYWKFCWVFLSPIIIGVTIIVNCVFYKPPELKGSDLYHYPGWAEGLGWLIGLFPISLIIIYFLYYFCKKGGFELLKYLGTPKNTWGPALTEHKVGYRYAPEEMMEEARSRELEHMSSFLRELRRREQDEDEEMRELEQIDLSTHGSGEKFMKIDLGPASGEESSISAFPMQCSSGQDVPPSNSSRQSDQSLPGYNETIENSPSVKLKQNCVVMTNLADGSEVHI